MIGDSDPFILASKFTTIRIFYDDPSNHVLDLFLDILYRFCPLCLLQIFLKHALCYLDGR